MPSPPSFGAQPYWDTRFTRNPIPFDWLSSPSTLDAPIAHVLNKTDDSEPQLLHIGCGTSLLSFHLRTHVQRPRQIHNIDHSSIAVDLGREREREISGGEGASGGANGEGDGAAEHEAMCMRWATADLLDHLSLLRVCKPGAYSAIVDKSTSDAVACADSIIISRPYPIELCSKRYDAVNVHVDGSFAREVIHPLFILAVNLALVAKTGAHWIALSYSSERFPWWDGTLYAPPRGIPDPRVLWRLVEQTEVEHEEKSEENNLDAVIHRPKVSNWLYVLERTEIPLFVRGDHI